MPRSFCRQGLGALIAKLGEQVPLSLSTPASRIVWGDRDVTVETPAGQDRRTRRHRHGVEQRAGRGQHQVHARYCRSGSSMPRRS